MFHYSFKIVIEYFKVLQNKVQSMKIAIKILVISIYLIYQSYLKNILLRSVVKNKLHNYYYKCNK